MNQVDCDHEWKPAGVWDGKIKHGDEASEDKRTGGVMYECVKCGTKVNSTEEIERLGGEVLEGFNVFGRRSGDSEE
jgi:hypothetical protein